MRTGSIRRRIAIGIGILLIALILANCRRDYVLGDLHTRRLRTTFALNRLQGFLEAYKIENNRLPPTLTGAISALEENGISYNTEHGVTLTAPGLDGWEHVLVYELRSPAVLVIRSVGANGVDERGAGDDIQREVILP